ncbi:hypothetical protein FRT60_12785 [Pseudomonas haemolytica]|uniref:Uncharacterized protein n=1 Tax=Pseudomonas haemolytica TaxID=2600065 RepID=A0A646NWW1_9PSED|nr:hypothetical protein [Pseudomonas haemolytica]MRJ21198.1 hypothetical protein [Pseudomonas haemolytica]
MKLSNPKKLVDMNSFLPLDGESRVEILYAGTELIINVFFEIGDGASDEKKTFRFKKAKYFYKLPFPGYSPFSCSSDEGIELLNCLVEYGYSEMVDIDKERSGISGYAHYRLFFHSIGVAVYVIAKSFSFE